MTVLIAKALTVVALGSGPWIPDTHKRHHHRRPRPDPAPMHTALASWYDLDGPGACGTGAQVGLHFAHRTMPCGTRVRMCHSGCVTATVADRGPYVYGREFDLNVNLRNAIRCTDLCTVRWRPL